jgi:PiT family inorganic phosphate transporter
MDFQELSVLLTNYPMLIVAILLVGIVIFVNGWTDAPNAIASCISTRVISPKAAILMAAFFNFLGVLSMFFISKATAETLTNMVDFGSDYSMALNALAAGMVGVVIYGVLARYFGIPSSESHALIAGLTGAALAAMSFGKDASIPFGIDSGWVKTIFGLVFSCVFGFVLGFLMTKLIEVLFKKLKRSKANKLFKNLEVLSGASMAYAHGAQDGMKFIGVLFLAIELAAKDYNFNNPSANLAETISTSNSLWWLALLVSLIMGFGTSIGGYRIIKKVGMGIVKLEPYQGFASDFTSSIGIFVSTLFGIPISTTQVKTSSILGVGATKGVKHVNRNVALEMVLTRLFTFPGCGLIGYIFASIFIAIFA